MPSCSGATRTAGPPTYGEYLVRLFKTRFSLELKAPEIPGQFNEFTRESLVVDVSNSIRSHLVVDVLARLVSLRGAPKHLRSDNGPEFVSRAIHMWIADNCMNIVLNDSAKPWQNGTNQSFNATLRDECLSLEWSHSRAEAKVVIETWRRHYNDIRPHSSLGYLIPTKFHQQY